MTKKVPVNIAAQAIAAGIFGDRARLTLVLTPIFDKDGKYDLFDWPQEVEKLFKEGFAFDFIPLAKDESWRTKDIFQDGRIRKLSARRKKPYWNAPQELTEYWRKVMGGESGFQALGKALDPNITKTVREPLRHALRDPENTPDIHGVGRDESVHQLSFERAAHEAASLCGRPIDTRPAPEPTLRDKVAKRKKEIKAWPANMPLTDALVAADVEDNTAYEDLGASRRRADGFAAARRKYLEATSPSAAIDALISAHGLLSKSTPLGAARYFGDAMNFTDASKRLQLRPVLSKGVKAAYRLASRTPPFDGEARSFVEPNEATEFARRRLFALQSNPSLGRLFRFVIDFDCDVDAFVKAAVIDGAGAPKYPETVLDRHPEEGSDLPKATLQYAKFLLLAPPALGEKGPRLWTTTKLRPPRGDIKGAAGHFLPCTREEIDARVKTPEADGRALAVFEQIDGMVDLGQRRDADIRYHIISLDPITALAGYDAVEKRRAVDKETLEKPGLLPQVRAELSNSHKNGTQRGGGLALVDGWRQLHGIARFLDSAAQRKKFDPNAKECHIVLDASDLTVGYKLDVGVRWKDDPSKGRNYWHTLMHRKVEYRPTRGTAPPVENLDKAITDLYWDREARINADDGLLQAPAALRDWILEKESGREHITVFMEEVIGAWRGDPLGLSCGKESHRLGSQDLCIDINYDLPTRPALTPPPLRFGWHYHFGLRAVFAGGVSLPLDRALGHYENSRSGELALPKASAFGEAFHRHERIEAPTIAIPDWLFGELKPEATHTRVVLKGKFPVPQANRMVVRSFADPANRAIAGLPRKEFESDLPGVAFDRRVILAPAVSLDFAALHDAFSKEKIERNVKMCEPRTLRDPEVQGDMETTIVKGEEEIIEEFTPVPDPRSRTSVAGGVTQRWQKVRVAWRPYKIFSRPRGGLQHVDHRAAWGGFPVYRASASCAKAKEPVDNDPVPPTPAPMTDEGEILHRVKGSREIFGGTDKARTILWSAVGVQLNSGGSIDRSGAAVFRPLPQGRRNDVERQPYYPDPAAVTLVVEVSVRGQGFKKERARRFGRKTVALYVKDDFATPAPPDYPDAVPVVLDVQRGKATDQLIEVASRIDYGRLPHAAQTTWSIPVAHIKVRLAPGEEARIRCWCAPNVTFLANMWVGLSVMAAMATVCGKKAEGKASADLLSLEPDETFVEDMKALTSLSIEQAPGRNSEEPRASLAGLPLPSIKQLLASAKALRERMLIEPVPEIAAVTEIEAVHAVDVPLQAPIAAPGREWRLLRASEKAIGDLLKPQDQCKVALGSLERLCQSENWDLQSQMPNAVDVLIDGSLVIHGPSTEAVEIRARGTAAARGRFDDVERGRSRDDRARGLWPKPDAQAPLEAKWLFGFEPSEDGQVEFKREVVTLLRVEGFAPGTDKAPGGLLQIDLLDFQRAAKATESLTEALDAPIRASRPTAFPDTRARWIEIFAVAMSRHAGALRTRYDELPEVLSNPKAARPQASKEEKDFAESEIRKTLLDSRWLPATVRPARAVALSSIPSFGWSDSHDIGKGLFESLFVTRSPLVRLRLKRPWFSAGEGERLGIVIWPPNLFDLPGARVRSDIIKPPPSDRAEIHLRALPEDGGGLSELQDSDLGPGGAWVTRWGADPTLAEGAVQGWLLSRDNFPGCLRGVDFGGPPSSHPGGPVLVENVLMPVPEGADAAESRAEQPPGGFMAVSLLTYTPLFDADQETWYVDVALNPCGAVYPFVRLGLVRFQPNAPRLLQVSEPIKEWTQVMPDRVLTAKAERNGETIEITATVEGHSSGPGYNRGHPESSPAQRSRIYFTLLRRRKGQGDDLPAAEVPHIEPLTPEPECGSACTTWKALFKIGHADFGRYKWSIFAEEVDRKRPTSYADEPRSSTTEDTNFVDTGPRFEARLELDDLKIGS